METQKDQHSSHTEPRLAPPGAGIPFPQKMLLRWVIRPFISEKAEWEKSKISFEKIAHKILQETEGLTESQLTQKVLVPPQRGLEDSSRYWSIAMTLEHLVIVGRSMAIPVESLSNGVVPDLKADLAQLKPLGHSTGAESIEEFRKFVTEEFPKMKIGNRNSNLRFLHPWFGPMTAKAWYWLYGPHQLIHLKQIREIKKGLCFL